MVLVADTNQSICELGRTPNKRNVAQ